MLGQQAALGEYFLDMPADRFAFPVGIGREDQRFSILRLVSDGLELPRLVGIGLPLHREPVVRID